MNDKIILVVVLAASIAYALFSLRELWKARADQAEEKVDRIIAKLSDLPVYRAYQTEYCSDPLIKTWIRDTGPEAIAWMSDWIYIVNMAAYGADKEPVWRLLMVDYLGQEEVEKAAREIRESDKSKEAIYVAIKRAFNWRDPFANYPFVNMDVEKVDQLIREPK